MSLYPGVIVSFHVEGRLHDDVQRNQSASIIISLGIDKSASELYVCVWVCVREREREREKE